MRQEHHHYHADLQALDDRCLNPSQAADLNSIIHRSRRQVLKGGLALAAIGLFGTSLLGCQRSSAPVASPLLGFSGVAAQTAADFDRVLVAEGYRAQPFFSWGDAVLDSAPVWLEDASRTGRRSCCRPVTTMTACTSSLSRRHPMSMVCW